MNTNAGSPAPTSTIDTRGIPSHECLNCGSCQFRVMAIFSEYDIAVWSLDGECFQCGAPVTVPCPTDDPEYVSDTSD